MGPDSLVRNLFAGVNEPLAPPNLTDLERMHIPVIEAPTSVRAAEFFPVHVHVGKAIPHPNHRHHFIEYLELYADEFFLARVDLAGVNTLPEATFWVSLSQRVRQLRVHERCNMHGVWLGRAPIAVEGLRET